MSSSDDFDSEYEKTTAHLGVFGRDLERMIIGLLEAEQIKTHSVISRVKAKNSVERKLERSDTERDMSSLTDILGIRIITYFRDEVDAVARVIECEFEIDEANSVNKTAMLDPDRFGYLSLHYISGLNSQRVRLRENWIYKGIKFEIQIRSILQHAWAEIEHDLGYKSEQAVPRSIRRRFSRLAGMLELADDEFVGIREDLAAHQRASAIAVDSGDLNVEIDQDSLSSLLDSDQRIRQLDQYIAHLMQRPYGDQIERRYIGSRAIGLSHSGFSSIADITTFLDDHESLVKEFSKQWLSRPSRGTRSPSSKPVPMGIAYFYIYLTKVTLQARDGKPTGLEPDGMAKTYKTALDRALSELGKTGNV
jgi:putative GTP pyrophosphokinase